MNKITKLINNLRSLENRVSGLNFSINLILKLSKKNNFNQINSNIEVILRHKESDLEIKKFEKISKLTNKPQNTESDPINVDKIDKIQLFKRNNFFDFMRINKISDLISDSKKEFEKYAKLIEAMDIETIKLKIDNEKSDEDITNYQEYKINLKFSKEQNKLIFKCFF